MSPSATYYPLSPLYFITFLKRRHSRAVVGTLRPADEKASLETPIPDRHAYVRLVPLDTKVCRPFHGYLSCNGHDYLFSDPVRVYPAA